MQNLGYYNGRIGLIEEMTVPMNDRACWFGDGVYDATYCRNYKIYMLDEHLGRFYESAGLLGIVVPQKKEELAALLCELVKKVDSDEQLVYWQVTRGTGMRSHAAPQPATPGNLWITLRPKSVMNTYEKVRLITYPDTRFLHCNIKTLNLIPSVTAATAAAAAGCYEAVFHRNGRVTECSHSNIHIIKDGVFRTAPADNYILAGVARANLIKSCGRLGIEVREEPFTVEQMMAADEVIVSSAGGFCLAAEEIDGRPVGGRAPELLRQLQDMAVRDYLEKTE
jgi:D-alanine transaminase